MGCSLKISIEANHVYKTCEITGKYPRETRLLSFVNMLSATLDVSSIILCEAKIFFLSLKYCYIFWEKDFHIDK